MSRFDLERKEDGIWFRIRHSTNFDVMHEEFKSCLKRPAWRQYPMRIVEVREVFETRVEWPGEPAPQPAGEASTTEGGR